VSDNCLDTTGAASAGLPGLTIGEQIGGMWKSIAENNKDLHIDIPYIKFIKTRKKKKKSERKYAVNNSQPMQPSSGNSKEGVITSILIAANIVCPMNKKS
jgi:hypothetical protein